MNFVCGISVHFGMRKLNMTPSSNELRSVINNWLFLLLDLS